MKKILIIAVALLSFAGIAYAATVPSEPAIYDSVLSAPLGSSDTTIFLKNANTNQGTPLTGFNCFTIDVNTPTLEYVCGTVSGTSVTGLTRNIDYFTGTTTNSNLSVPSHRTGADIRITDFPILQIIHNILSGLDTLPSTLHYTAGTTISGSDSQAIPNVAYVNATAISGAPNSSETVNGISQLATGVQAASSTATGSTGARLVLPASLATSSDDVAGLHVVVTQNSGKINWNQVDLATPFTITGTTTISGVNSGFLDAAASSTFTSTVNLNGAVSFGSTATFSGAATFNSSVAGLHITVASTTSMSGTATSSSITIPAGTLSASSTIDVYADFSCNNGSSTNSCSLYLRDANSNTYATFSVSSPWNNAATLDCNIHAQIVFNNSLSAEVTLGQSSGFVQPNAAVVGWACPANIVSSNSINFANAQTLKLVTGGTGTPTLNQFVVVISK